MTAGTPTNVQLPSDSAGSCPCHKGDYLAHSHIRDNVATWLDEAVAVGQQAWTVPVAQNPLTQGLADVAGHGQAP